ncbi:hypothetical protein VaNZ11_016355 [Volvox africanus]|uniref:Uncharacterized protein n=1 Tax=Volvox africanus TaxID=51714 RepID=A0ABQ5SN72_9CHLO|nr:hypothetical protein VaNZ11_016355 [Volvox africanus]
MDNSGTFALPQAWEDSSRWISKAFLDILRQNIIPNLAHFYAAAHDGEDSDTFPGLSWKGANDRRPEGRIAREVQAAITLVCADWSAAQRQAKQEVVQVRLWDGEHVCSLASHLRCRDRIRTLRLQSPQPDVTNVPGMVAAVSDLLYGSITGATSAVDGPRDVRAGDLISTGGVRGGGGEGGGPAVQSAGGNSSGVGCSQGGSGANGVGTEVTQMSTDVTRIGSALPCSLCCLEAEGPTAVPLLLLAAAELPHLEALSLSQLPAAWTYEEGDLPWPPHAETRLRALVPQEVFDQAADPALHALMYGPAVYWRFKSYWLSYEGALAAVILHRGRQLRELSLEAPARGVSLQMLDMLASQGPSRLEALRLSNFGLRGKPNQSLRLPLERAGLRLDAALRSLASISTTLLQQQQDHHHNLNQNHLHEQSRPHQQARTHPVLQQRPTVCTGQQRGGSSVPLCTEDALRLGITGRVCEGVSRLGGGSDCCGLTRLELLSCGVQPLHPEALEGLTGLQILSLRGSSFTWRGRLPDLRHLSRLRSLDLRRCDWSAGRDTPWDRLLLLPPSLEALDLIGFSSLSTVNLGSLERLTALAELSDITLEPDPADRSAQLLQPPYTGLAALTCMDTIRSYVGKAKMRRVDGCSRLTSLPWIRHEITHRGSTEEESDEEDYALASGASGRSEGSSSEETVRHGTTARRRSRCTTYWGKKHRGGGGGGDGDSSNSSECQSKDCRNGGNGEDSGGDPGANSVVQSAPPLATVSAVKEPPLVSLTLYGVLPQHISDLFQVLPLLTRLVFEGGKEEHHGDDGEGEDDYEGVGEFVIIAGEMPRLRELELRAGLLGYGRLALGPATSLRRLVVDDVEYVDVRYMELPPSLQYLSLTAFYGLPELYHLAEGPVLSTALVRAAADRLERAAKSAGASEGVVMPIAGMHLEKDVSSRDLTRALEAEVERQFVQRLLPPLRQLHMLQLNWNIVTHGPLMTHGSQGPDTVLASVATSGRDVGVASRSACSGGTGNVGARSGEKGGGGVSSGTAARWRFPQLPLLEELDIPWMQELPNEDLWRLLVSCPALRAITHRNGSLRAVRDAEGSWIRRSVRTDGVESAMAAAK